MAGYSWPWRFDYPGWKSSTFAPSCDRTRLISGWLSVRSVTFSVLEKISGINSTPTFSDLACTNGVWLKAGSSEIEMSSAFTEPENSDSDRLPTLTCRPSAAVKSDSNSGRKELALMNKRNNNQR